MGGFCLLVELHREVSALQPAQQVCFYRKALAIPVSLDTGRCNDDKGQCCAVECRILQYSSV